VFLPPECSGSSGCWAASVAAGAAGAAGALVCAGAAALASARLFFVLPELALSVLLVYVHVQE
jgi:hypothetical protein